MSTRTALYTLVAAASFVLAGVQAIGADERLPEASVIGLGQQVAGAALRTNSSSPRLVRTGVVVAGHR